MKKQLSLSVIIWLAIVLIVTGCNTKETSIEKQKEEPIVNEETVSEEVIEVEQDEEEERAPVIDEQDSEHLLIEEMSFVPPSDCDEEAMDSFLNEYVKFACMFDINGVSFNIAIEPLLTDMEVAEYIDLARENYDYFPNASINYYEFSGIEWANLIGELHEGIITEQLIAIYNKNTYILTYTSPTEDYDKYVDHIIEIFQTIEFH